MGNSPSVFIDVITTGAHHIHQPDECKILNAVREYHVVSYPVTMEIPASQELKFSPYIDVVDSFSCLTIGATFDILIDGVKHYQNIENFVIVPTALYNSTVTIQVHNQGPVVFMCKGYTCSEIERSILCSQKVKSRTTKYRGGKGSPIK